MAERERIGFLGLGIMGSRMAANVARAGFEITVWNRTRQTAEDWVAKHGGSFVDTPAALAQEADVLVSIVADGPVVERVMLGEDGVIGGARAGQLVIDCSTIAPAEAQRVAQGLAEKGVAFVDAPVSGSSPKAEDGTLTIMTGGENADLERAQPVFEAMGELIVNCGPVGSGQGVKLVNQAVAAANCATVAQALVAADAQGLDLDALVEVMGASSGNSTMLGLKAGPMRAHDYDPLFKLAHMLKDVRLALEEAQRAEVAFPSAALTRDLLVAGMARGLAEQDFAAVLEPVEGLSGHRLGEGSRG
jgi:3-hydroxyisobutyrate dehydrogenase-like beta-hydroxyacid dehydrogenase